MQPIKYWKDYTPSVRAYLVSMSLVGFANGLFDAIYNFFLMKHGVQRAGIGTIYAISMALMAIAIVPLVRVSKRPLKAWFLLPTSIAWALPFWMVPRSTTVSSSAIAMSLIAVGLIAMLAVGNSIFAVQVSAEKRPAFFATFFVFYLTAAMVGSIAAGALTTMNVGGIAPLSYEAILYTSAAIASCVVVVRVLAVRTSVLPVHIAGPVVKGHTGMRNLVLLTAGAMLLGGSITLVFRFANIILQSALGIGAGKVAIVLGGEKVFGVCGALSAPLLLKKMSVRSSMLALALVTCMVLVAQTLTASVTVFLMLYFWRFGLNYVTMPVLDTLALSGFRQSNPIVSTSARQFGFYAGGAASAIAFGELLQSDRWEACILMSAAAALAGGVVLSLVREEPPLSPPE